MSEDKPLREVPVNELDLQLQTTNPKWGDYISPEFRARLMTESKTEDELKLWELLQFYTRDVRLGNLSATELNYCRYYLDLAADCLENQYKNSFIIALSRAVTVLETSQSKGGFLRKLFGTVRHESESIERREPIKRGLFGQKKGEGGQ